MLLITDPEVRNLIREALVWKQACEESGGYDDYAFGGYTALKVAVSQLTGTEMTLVNDFFREIEQEGMPEWLSGPKSGLE